MKTGSEIEEIKSVDDLTIKIQKECHATVEMVIKKHLKITTT
jgi:hypothetical protein